MDTLKLFYKGGFLFLNVKKAVFFIKFNLCCLFLFCSTHYLFGQCNTCTYTISSNNNSYYNLNSGETFCVTSTGNFTGQLNLMAGASICNQGTLHPSSFNIGAGTIDNYGTISFNYLFNVNSGATINNYGTINALGNFELNQASAFNNLGGTLNISGNCGFDDNSTFVQSSGTFNANSNVAVNNSSLVSFDDGTVSVLNDLSLNNPTCTLNLNVSAVLGNNLVLNTGYLSINNQCSLTVAGNYSQNGASIYVNHFLEVYGNFTHNSGNVQGPASGCSRISVFGNSTNSGLFGTSGNIDFCDNGNPSNGWDNNWGSMGSGVTFCTCTPSSNQSAQWVGSNSNWHDVSNWSNASIPNSNTNVTIPNALSSYPVINANVQTADLTISPGASLTISNGYELSIFGDFDGNSWIQTTGTVVFEGAAAQSVSGATFFNLEIDNSNNVSADSDFDVTNLLELQNGNLDVNNYVITLKSGAVLMDVNGSINGDLSVELEIPNINGFHYVSAPVQGQTMADLNDDFTLIGLGGNLASLPFPNIWYYDETNPSNNSADGWTVPANLNYSMTVGQGFAFNVDVGTILDFTGPVNTGQITKNLSHTVSANGSISNPPDGWELIGNPYPAPIDWELAQLTNIDKGIYFWSPDISQYASYIDGITVNGGVQYISSFQAFFVRTNSDVPASSPSVVFDDNMKVADPSVNIFKSGNASDSILRISLVGPSGTDETVIRYSKTATYAFDKSKDAYKMLSDVNAVPNIGSFAQGINLSVNSLPLSAPKDTIPLFFKSGTAGIHTLKLDSSSLLLNDVNVWLIDAQTNLIHPIKSAEFSFNSIANNQSDRFSLIVDRIESSLIEVNDESKDIKLYCNRKNLFIRSSQDIPSSIVNIYNSLGQLQFQSNELYLSPVPQIINVNSLRSAFYIITIFSENDIIQSKWIWIP
jgi:hypothetical protein